MNIWEGVMSLKNVKNVPLFVLYTLLIWLCYFYHFYITFYCFQFTEHLSFLAGMVMFVGGTFAVIVPTPNGAGPWHFAVITMMMLYGGKCYGCGYLCADSAWHTDVAGDSAGHLRGVAPGVGE